MNNLRIALYVIWFLLPLFFFIMALWSRLEQLSKSAKKQNPGDFYRQGVFVLICVLMSVAIDQYAIDFLADSFSPDFIPVTFYRVILLPLVLFIAAKIIGPTKDVQISKAPNPTMAQRRRR